MFPRKKKQSAGEKDSSKKPASGSKSTRTSGKQPGKGPSRNPAGDEGTGRSSPKPTPGHQSSSNSSLHAEFLLSPSNASEIHHYTGGKFVEGWAPNKPALSLRESTLSGGRKGKGKGAHMSSESSSPVSSSPGVATSRNTPPLRLDTNNLPRGDKRPSHVATKTYKGATSGDKTVDSAKRRESASPSLSQSPMEQESPRVDSQATQAKAPKHHDPSSIAIDSRRTPPVQQRITKSPKTGIYDDSLNWDHGPSPDRMDTDSPLSSLPQDSNSPIMGAPLAGSGNTNLSGSNIIRSACHSCRTRKMKCDLTRPACSTCKRLSKDCSYPPDRLAACNLCHIRAIKCNKARPTCSECKAISQNCIYPILTYETQLAPAPDPKKKEDSKRRMLEGSRKGGQVTKAKAEARRAQRGGIAEPHAAGGAASMGGMVGMGSPPRVYQSPYTGVYQSPYITERQGERQTEQQPQEEGESATGGGGHQLEFQQEQQGEEDLRRQIEENRDREARGLSPLHQFYK